MIQLFQGAAKKSRKLSHFRRNLETSYEDRAILDLDRNGEASGQLWQLRKTMRTHTLTTGELRRNSTVTSVAYIFRNPATSLPKKKQKFGSTS
jgi:hypothetical protein